MSASFGLVKFKSTGNIYYCCYEGTSDLLNPHICTPEACYNLEMDMFCAISYCRGLRELHYDQTFPDNVTDLDEVEIYADYGNGFYWKGFGSESCKMIKGPLDPWNERGVCITDGTPEWAKKELEFLNS